MMASLALRHTPPPVNYLPAPVSLAQAVWSELRYAREPVSLYDIMLALRARAIEPRINAVTAQISLWIDAGHVERDDHARYALLPVRRIRAEPPVVVTPVPTRKPRTSAHISLRKRLWTAIRIMRKFDLVSLMLTADATHTQAMGLVRILEWTGMLLRMDGGSHWQVVRPLGPIPPVINRDASSGETVTTITDPNTGDIFTHRTPARPRIPARQTAAGMREKG